jgi:hypothetical protein
MTSGTDGLHHAVTDESAVAGRDSGTYPAVCTHLVRPESLASAPGPPCPECRAARGSAARHRICPDGTEGLLAWLMHAYILIHNHSRPRGRTPLHRAGGLAVS